MKLKTTVLFAAFGVLASAAAAFAVPVSKGSIGTDAYGPAWKGGERGERDPSDAKDPARIAAGDTLQIDARLGHASIAKNAKGETFLFAQVTATDDKAKSEKTSPLNLALVIDRSGSMKGERIANAMNAAVGAIERMRDGDSVTVVAFDTTAQVIVPPTRLGGQNRAGLESAVRAIRLGGDTCISCGLEEGMRQLNLTSLGGDRLNRMILLSDGATNQGVKDIGGLRSMANRMHGKGVTISTVGVDVDFDEKVMAAIAAEANGKHHFVANASALTNVFAQEFDDLLASVAKEAELAIDLAPGVEVEEVFDRSFRREGSKLVVPFGTFSASQEKTVLVKLRVPSDRDGKVPVADVKLAYRDLVKRTDGSCAGSLAIAVKADGNEQKDLDPFVAARVERTRTAQTLTEANKLFEQGRAGDARAKLAARKDALAKTESQSLALAQGGFAAAPAKGRALDRDFGAQRDAVEEAERSFAPPPPVARPSTGIANAAPFDGSQSREGKASVRSNQQRAFDLAR